MHAWWKYVNAFPNRRKKVSGVMAALMGVQPKSLQCNLNSKICKFCGVQESTEHILFECARSEIREELWDKLVKEMPVALKEECQSNDRTSLILSCFNNTYIREWQDIYHGIVDFVHGIFFERYNNYIQSEM